MAVTIKSKEEIQCMRDAGKILAEVHEKLAEIIAPGITSLEIDRKGEELIRNAGCIPSFKGYEGYPASICVSNWMKNVKNKWSYKRKFLKTA